jgi:hypothetical protein
MQKVIITCLFSIFIHFATAQHTLVMKSGEKMNGEVQGIKDGTVSFLFKGNTMSFKISEVSAIYFDDKAMGNNEVKTANSASGTKGISYVMNGRKLINQPKVDNLTQEKGIVVVSIDIDKYGHVKKAEPGAEGTTTTSNYLLTKAKQAAESAIFDNCATCPLDSKGTITIIF